MLPVFLWILTSGENYFSVSISFQTPAANAPPANGPRITHKDHGVQDHGVGSTDHFQEPAVMTLIHYCFHSHFIYLDK